MTSRLTQLLMLVIFLNFIACKKNEINLSPTKKEILGYWIPTKLIINNTDTSNYLLSDSSHYPKFHFYLESQNSQALELLQGYNIPDSNFYCFKIGVWEQAGDYLNFIFEGYPFSIGPYLHNHDLVSWKINFLRDSLNMNTIFRNDTANLILKKVS